MEKNWKYKGYKCGAWLTGDGNIKFYGVKNTKDDTDRKSGLIVTPTSDETTDKLESGVSELNERIDASEEEIQANYL